MARRTATEVKGRSPIDITGDLPSYKESFGSVLRWVRRGGPVREKRLLRWLETVITKTGYTAEERNRILVSKLIVALLPRSKRVIKGILSARRRPYCRELQFSIFCYLDEVPLHDSLKKSEFSILDEVCRYLTTVRSDQALSVWMAEDLLSNHWKQDSVRRVLAKYHNAGVTPLGRRALSRVLSIIDKRE